MNKIALVSKWSKCAQSPRLTVQCFATELPHPTHTHTRTSHIHIHSGIKYQLYAAIFCDYAVLEVQENSNTGQGVRSGMISNGVRSGITLNGVTSG